MEAVVNVCALPNSTIAAPTNTEEVNRTALFPMLSISGPTNIEATKIPK